MSLRDIRERYGVSFERGNRVMCGGRFGTVAGATDSHIRVKFDGRQISSPCDPLEVQPCDPLHAHAHAHAQAQPRHELTAPGPLS